MFRLLSDEEFPEGYKAFCPHCSAAFTNKQDLIKHFREEHDKSYAQKFPIILCDMCCFVAQGCYKTHEKHRQCHKLSVVYKCTRCLFLSPTYRGILKHAHRTFCDRHDLVQIVGAQSPVPVNELESTASRRKVTENARKYRCKDKAKPHAMNRHTSDNDSDEDTVKIVQMDDSESHTQIKTESLETLRPKIKLKVINRHKSKPFNLIKLIPSKRPVFTLSSHTRTSGVVIPSKRVLGDIVDRSKECESQKSRKLDSGHRVSPDIQTVQSLTEAQVESQSPDSWVDKVKPSSREVQEIKTRASLRTMSEPEDPVEELKLRKVCPFDSKEEMTVTESEDQTRKRKVSKSELLDKAGLSLNEPRVLLEKMPEFIELEEDTSSGGDVKPASSTAAADAEITTDNTPSSDGRSVSSIIYRCNL